MTPMNRRAYGKGPVRQSPKLPPFPHTSDMLLELLDRNTKNEVTLAELTTGLMNRVLGFIMMLFAIPCTLPMPPGIPFLCGLVLVASGIHLVVGRETLWLPRFVSDRAIKRIVLERIVSRTVPIARRLERLCRPRWAWLTTRLGRSCIGAIVVVLAIILLLPIPFLGNMPPGLAISILALGLIERDGLVISLGIFASVAAVVLSSAMAWGAIRGLGWIF